MKHYSFSSRLTALLLTMVFTILSICATENTVYASGFSFIVLSHYQKTINIGDTFYLTAVANTGKELTYKSSNSRVASVNSYGEVTGKKSGTCIIRVKSGKMESSCQVAVRKTAISLSTRSLTMENGASFTLRAITSTGAPVTWKSSKKSVATIDDYGNIEALKPGTTTITASAEGTKTTCHVTVKQPTVTLNQTRATLYRTQALKLSAKVSSGKSPTWRSRKTSVATVDETGVVTARKHGTALISAKVDGITRYCEVTVLSPDIELNTYELTLKKGKSFTLKATVSSGIQPTFKCSSKKIATVTSGGKIIAKKKGKCTIYVSEDGTKESCKLIVTK